MASPVEERFVRENLVGGKVFEFGCAPGKLATELTREGYDVYGIDLYDVDPDTEFEFLKSDIMDIISSRSFENVIAVSSFEHAGIESENYFEGNNPDPNYHYLVANKLRGMINKDGLLIITVPFGNDTVFFVDKDGNNGTAEEIPNPSWGFRVFSEHGIQKVFSYMNMILCEVYKKSGEDYFDINSWEKIDPEDCVSYDNKNRAVMCCVLKEDWNWMVNKFGDGISWDYHVDEILAETKDPFYSEDGSRVFEDAKDHIQTDTPVGERKALDCGCHIGRFIDVVRNYGFDYTGVDQSKKALDVARKNKEYGNWVECFLWDMPFEEEFDFAFTNAVLQHNVLYEQEKIVPVIYKALKPGGIFLMTESTERVQTNTQRTQQGWIDMVESFGFKLIKTSHVNPIGIEDKYMFAKETK